MRTVFDNKHVHMWPCFHHTILVLIFASPSQMVNKITKEMKRHQFNVPIHANHSDLENSDFLNGPDSSVTKFFKSWTHWKAM